MTRLLALALLLYTIAGCSDGENKTSGSASSIAARPLVFATNYPLVYFIERIATPVVEVRFLVPGDDDPAHWQPTPEDVLVMQKADLVVLNGASYESWLKVVTLPPSRIVVTTGGLGDRLISQEQKTTHSHGLEGDHEHSGTAFTTWLDPMLAAEQAGAIKDALAARWPQHTARFSTQLAGLTRDLTALDTEMAEAVAGNPDLPVFPAAWMIWEDTPLPQISERLESLGIRSVVIDPCAVTPIEADFLSVMDRNLQALRLVFAIDNPQTGEQVTGPN